MPLFPVVKVFVLEAIVFQSCGLSLYMSDKPWTGIWIANIDLFLSRRDVSGEMRKVHTNNQCWEYDWQKNDGIIIIASSPRCNSIQNKHLFQGHDLPDKPMSIALGAVIPALSPCWAKSPSEKNHCTLSARLSAKGTFVWFSFFHFCSMHSVGLKQDISLL